MKVFITHGHNENAKLKIKDYVRTRLNHEPVILGEQPGRQGLTIIEALERFSVGCGFAVILLTGDDTTTDGGQRARQNVVHEAGYFQGRLGRSKVVLLVQRGIEIPSNLSGLFYLEFTNDVKEVFEDLRQILTAVDASVSARKVSSSEDLDFVRKILVLASSGRFHTNIARGEPLKSLDTLVHMNAISNPDTGIPDLSKLPDGKIPKTEVHYFDFDSGGVVRLAPNTKVAELRSPVVIAVIDGFGGVSDNKLAAKMVAAVGGENPVAKQLIRELISDERLRY